MTVRDFPENFLWGSASSAYQTEGGNTNNDWFQWEHADGTSAAEPAGDGIDHFSRYDSDFALLAALGQRAHRMGLEWSRIEPAEGEFSQAALDHYRRVLLSMRRHGLLAVVTLHHFTLPRWLTDRGGWLAADAVEVFGRYVDRVAAELGDLMPYVGPINEPQILALGSYGQGMFPPGVRDLAVATTVSFTLMKAHRRAVTGLRAGKGNPLIGACLQLIPFEPLLPGDPGDEAAAAALNSMMTELPLADLAAGGDVGDWVGLQYYTRARIDSRSPQLLAPPPDGAETTDSGWEVYPTGFGQMLQRISAARLPIIVTENGIATTDDSQRLRFLAAHLAVLKQEMDRGLDVRGYFVWAAFDNFEWGAGFRPRFGMIGIDRADGMRRVVRPSAVAFGRLASTGDLSEMTGAAR